MRGHRRSERPSGRIVTFTRDALGRTSAVGSSTTGASMSLAANVLYREFGPLRSLTYGNGLVLTKTYNQDYQLDVLRLQEPVSGSNLIHRTHAYADGYNLTGITDSAVSGRNESYGYDPADRLATAQGPWGSLSYSYDLVGNRLTEALGAATGSYAYAAGSNRLAAVTQGASTLRSFGHEATGSISQDTRAGSVYAYVYNDRDRLKQSRLGNVVQANYRYDFFERLNWRQMFNPAGATHYIQDLAGRLIAEADAATGATLREYVWLDDMPLAVIDSTRTGSVVYYVHADHLNRPLKMTDANKAVVWDATYKPFGEVVSIAGSATLNLRFPGQYFLIENGLAYNWHRHYDASIGRYTQPDPLGFISGPSVFAYARSAPTQYVDPEGRQIVIVPRPTPPMTPIPPGVFDEWRRHSERGLKGLIAVIGGLCRRALSGLGGGDDYRRCIDAANGSTDDWNEFCRSLGSGLNNVVGGQSVKRACWEKAFDSPTKKENWCENQFGPS